MEYDHILARRKRTCNSLKIICTHLSNLFFLLFTLHYFLLHNHAVKFLNVEKQTYNVHNRLTIVSCFGVEIVYQLLDALLYKKLQQEGRPQLTCFVLSILDWMLLPGKLQQILKWGAFHSEIFSDKWNTIFRTTSQGILKFLIFLNRSFRSIFFCLSKLLKFLVAYLVRFSKIQKRPDFWKLSNEISVPIVHISKLSEFLVTWKAPMRLSLNGLFLRSID